MRASPKGGPKICRPTGNWPSILPQGTEIPGTPASDPVTVYISARYIWRGSLVRSPNWKGGTGKADAILTPTSPVPPFQLSERTKDALQHDCARYTWRGPLVRSANWKGGTGE